MNLLAIEIDLDSFFDVNLIVFTTISFAFSVVIITFLVFALRPLNRAKIIQGKTPEKISTMYIRLLIYGFAQFMAFVTDVFFSYIRARLQATLIHNYCISDPYVLQVSICTIQRF